MRSLVLIYSIFIPIAGFQFFEDDCNSESFVNKNHFSESEHSDDENKWKICGIVKDVAIKWQYYDAKKHKLIVSEQERSTFLKFIWLEATDCGPEH